MLNLHRLCQALLALGGLPFAAATAPEQAPQAFVVAFNADDDNENGLRDFEEPPFASDDDVVVVWSADAAPQHLRIDCDAPAGAVRFQLAADRRSVVVEALRPADAGWDGRFRMMLVVDGAQQTIACRVAPLLVRSSLAPAHTVFVREFPERNDRLIEQLREIVTRANADFHIVPAGEPYASNHIWLQDTVEFLETNGVRSRMTVALAGVRNRALDLFARDRLLGPGVGYLQVGEYRKPYAEGEGGASWIDWFGNLEASPATARHPHGCVLYGVDETLNAQLHPQVVALLGAQGVQSPLPLDVGWLTIKHVDEMVAFVPAKEGGFLVLVPDPTAALAVLRDLEQAGHGATPVLDVFEDDVTVASLLADTDFVAANERLWAERIEPMSRALIEGIGATPDRLRRMPVLFQADGMPRTPNVVNCLVLPGRNGQSGRVAMADPNGPLINGQDAFQAETRRRLADASATLHFVDDRQYHRWSGNVHCGTNAIRPIGF